MKKYLLTIAAMLFCISSAIIAEKKPVVIIKQLPPVTPKSPEMGTSAPIKGEYDTEKLTLDFTGYYGNVAITLVDVTTNQTVCVENETVFSPDTVSVDLSTLPSSTYYIFIELDNGDCYFAMIVI